MLENSKSKQEDIHLGTHGEDYGNWMSTPVFYMLGGGTALAVVIATLFFAVFNLFILGVVFVVIALALLLFILWAAWVRHQYSFSGGGMMEKVHRTILSELDYNGKGTLLEVGCGSGALAIRVALTWPETKVVGIDYWSVIYNYSKELCEKNAQSEGVGKQCSFQQGDARKLDIPDESVDAVISNYVYHNITGANKQELLLESLRPLKKGGVFALNDCMRPKLYGDMDAFAQKLRDMGYQEVRYVDTATEVFGSPKIASILFLSGSKMLVGKK